MRLVTVIVEEGDDPTGLASDDGAAEMEKSTKWNVTGVEMRAAVPTAAVAFIET